MISENEKSRDANTARVGRGDPTEGSGASAAGDSPETSASGDRPRTSASGDSPRTSASGDRPRTSASGDRPQASVAEGSRAAGPAGSSFQDDSAGLILALQRATHATLRLLAARLAEENLTASEINALANMADGQFRSVGELASCTGTKPTTLTSVLDRLTRRGLLTRETDLADRRSFLLHLTPEGQRAAQAAHAAIEAIGAAAISPLTAAEVAGFMRVIRALEEVAQ